MKSDFTDILEPRAESLEKYAPYYEGIAQNQLASFHQATVFIQEHMQPLFVSHGVTMSDPAIYANAATSAPVVAPFIPASEMIDNGFPSDKKANLIYVFGKLNPDTDHPKDSMNVALTIQMFFGTATTPPNPEGVWVEVCKQVPPAPTNTSSIPMPVPPQPTAPDFDSFAPPPVHGHNDDGTPKKKK